MLNLISLRVWILLLYRKTRNTNLRQVTNLLSSIDSFGNNSERKISDKDCKKGKVRSSAMWSWGWFFIIFACCGVLDPRCSRFTQQLLVIFFSTGHYAQKKIDLHTSYPFINSCMHTWLQSTTVDKNVPKSLILRNTIPNREKYL